MHVKRGYSMKVEFDNNELKEILEKCMGSEYEDTIFGRILTGKPNVNSIDFTSSYPAQKEFDNCYVNKYHCSECMHLFKCDKVKKGMGNSYHEMYQKVFHDILYLASCNDVSIREVQFMGNIKKIIDEATDTAKRSMYTALFDFLELENGLEDIISFEYDEETDTTTIKFYC